MNKKKILAVVLCIAAVFSTVIIASSSINSTQVRTESDTVMPSYILKEYDGRLAVYNYGEDEPDRVLNVYIDSLPQFDQEHLKTGVYAYSAEQLDRLIEDYDG